MFVAPMMAVGYNVLPSHTVLTHCLVLRWKIMNQCTYTGYTCSYTASKGCYFHLKIGLRCRFGKQTVYFSLYTVSIFIMIQVLCGYLWFPAVEIMMVVGYNV